ncbi:hypothetical protein KBD49_08120 [Myxococcota bacterium]|nr:hypothetical protein [Myxococcota bacterium]
MRGTRQPGLGWAVPALLVLGSMLPAVAGGKEVEARVYGSTETFLMTRQVLDPADPTSRLFQLPIYEYLTVGADDMGVPGLSLQVRGFGRVHPLNRADDRVFDGDLLVGTLSYRDPRGRVQATLGRQLRTTGAGNLLLLDGAFVRVRPGVDLTLEAYGGWVPDARFDHALDRAAFGARVAWEPWDWGRLGLSWSGEHDQGILSRSAIGIDYGVRAIRNVEFGGFLAVDLQTRAFQETRNTLAWRIDGQWRLAFDVNYYDPVARLPLTSIFRVFTNRRNLSAGAEVDFSSRGALSSHVRGRYFAYGFQDHGFEVGWKPVLRFGERGGVRGLTGLELVYLKGPDNGYFETRVFGSMRPIPRLEVALDYDLYVYDRALRGWESWRRADPRGTTPYLYTGEGGTRTSHVTSLKVGVDLFQGASLLAEAGVAVTPDFLQQWSGLLKFCYAFDRRVK